MGSEKFCLRWNDFESNISNALQDLRNDKDFFDVTIACEDEQIQAHKVILSACSPFFRNVLRRNPHQNPLLYLKGVKYTDIQAVLNFMYHGEVNIAQDELNTFLAVAEDLKVKGLTQNHPESQNVSTHNNEKQKPQSQYKPSSPVRGSIPLTTQRNKSANTNHNTIPSLDDHIVEEVVSIKSEPRESQTVSATLNTEQTGYNSYTRAQNVTPQGHSLVSYQEDAVYEEEDYTNYGEDRQYGDVTSYQGNDGEVNASGFTFQSPDELLQFVSKSEEDNKFLCSFCGKFKAVRKGLVRNHIESIHFPGVFTYSCEICKKDFLGKNALAVHNSEKHPLRPKINIK